MKANKTVSDAKQPRVSNINKQIINSLIVLISICVTLVCAEIAYRFTLYLDDVFQNKFRVGSFVYGTFDDKYGVKYPSNKSFTLFNITNGQVTWCPEAISISNKDGINGKTTIAEYDTADIRILAFGDSFTHWNQEGYTWPDLLEDILSKTLNINVRVLNYGRGTYGILQMFDLASDKVLEHNPHLLIFAFVSDDLTRNRWWTKPLLIEGYERPLLSPSKIDFDLSIASDEYLVNPLVDLQWCKNSMVNSGPNRILDNVVEQYNKIRKSTFKTRGIHENSIFSVNHSYLYNRLMLRHPFSSQSRPTIPRVDFDDFAKDKQLLNKIQNIKETNTLYIMFHLPQQSDIESSQIKLTKRQELLLNSLQAITSNQVVFLHNNLDKNTVPNKIDLLPHDGHPNYDGLKLYAETIGNYLIKNGLVHKKVSR